MPTYTKIDEDTVAVTTEVDKEKLEWQLAMAERKLAKAQAQITALQAQLDILK